MTELREKLNTILEEKNIKIVPENLKAGVEAFGIQGNFTADADATPEDIAKDKTAYVNGEKVVGTLEVSGGSASDLNVKMSDTISSWTLLDTIEKLDFTNVDTSLCTNFSFTSYPKLREVIGINLSSQGNMTRLCSRCSELEIFLCRGGSESNDFLNQIFEECGKLKRVGTINADGVKNMSCPFYNCVELEEFGGFINIGKSCNKTRPNSSVYRLDLSYSPKLTHESLMNTINGLYDLNLTYDVANGGTLYTQDLILGSTNLAKLTADEIAIATAKGWTVS